MKFEWDEEKRQINLQKHGIDFLDAAECFEAAMYVRLDTRRDYGENRFVAIGLLRSEVVTVVYTMRGETIRLISLRRATRTEKGIYEKGR